MPSRQISSGEYFLMNPCSWSLSIGVFLVLDGFGGLDILLFLLGFGN